MHLTRTLLGLLAVLGACSDESAAPSGAAGPTADDLPRAQVTYPREWTAVDRAAPELEGRFGPHDWTLCRGQEPCTAITWSPVEYAGTRPTLTTLVTSRRIWRTTPTRERWRRKWRWVDPLLGACLGDALSLHLDATGVTRKLIEHDDGFWWTYSFEGVGPCDIHGGIELSVTEEAGRSTQLTAGGNPWGSPAAVGFATDVLHQTYGGPLGPQ